MKAVEIREMNTAELHAELDSMRRHLFDLRAQAVTEKLENPHQLKLAQKNISRVLTVLRERGETGIEEKQYHLESMTARRMRG